MKIKRKKTKSLKFVAISIGGIILALILFLLVCNQTIIENFKLKDINDSKETTSQNVETTVHDVNLVINEIDKETATILAGSKVQISQVDENGQVSISVYDAITGENLDVNTTSNEIEDETNEIDENKTNETIEISDEDEGIEVGENGIRLKVSGMEEGKNYKIEIEQVDTVEGYESTFKTVNITIEVGTDGNIIAYISKIIDQDGNETLGSKDETAVFMYEESDGTITITENEDVLIYYAIGSWKEGLTEEELDKEENWNKYDTSTGITVEKNCTIYTKSKYITESYSETQELVISNIDKQTPTITVTTSDEEEHNETSIGVKITDDETDSYAASGIIAYAMTSENEEPTSWTEITNTTEYETTIDEITENGIYYIWAKDEVGNISSQEFEITNIVYDIVAIILDSPYDELNGTEYTTLTELLEALNSVSEVEEGTVIIQIVHEIKFENIEFSNENQTIVVDLNGYTISSKSLDTATITVSSGDVQIVDNKYTISDYIDDSEKAAELEEKYSANTNDNGDAQNGTISSENYIAIKIDGGTLTLGEDDGVVSIQTPIIEGAQKGIYNVDGTFNFYDGIIISKSTIEGTISDTPALYDPTTSSTETDGVYQSYLAKVSGIEALIGKTRYTKIETAINAANNIKGNSSTQVEIDIVTDIIIDETRGTTDDDGEIIVAGQLLVDDTKNILLDLNGYSLTTTEAVYVIENEGTLEIIDSSLEEDHEYSDSDSTTIQGKINSSTYGVIENYGTLTLTSGALVCTKDGTSSLYIYEVNNHASFTMQGGYVKCTTNYTNIIRNLGDGTTNFIDGRIYGSGSYNRGIQNEGSGNIMMSGGSITIPNTNTYSRGIYNEGTGNITMTGGTITISSKVTLSSCNYAMSNTSTGNIVIDGGTITGTTYGYGIYNSSTGSIMINSGSITTYWYGINNASTGTVTMNGGTITTKYYEPIINSSSGSVTMTGGTISTSVNCGIRNQSSGTVEMSSGTITVTAGSSYYGIVNNSTGTIKITGGTISATNSYGIYNNSTGTIIISNGTISGTHGLGNIGTGTIIITGGTVTAKTGYGINNNSTGTVTIGEKDGNVINDLVISSTSSAGVKNASTGIINYYDGIISGVSSTGAIIGAINEIEESTTIQRTIEDSIEEDCLVTGYAVAQIGETTYETLQDAIDAVNENEQTTIKIINNFTITESEQAIVDENKQIELDLNGYTITVLCYTNGIVNCGKLSITDLIEDKEGTIISKAYGAIENQGDLTFEEGTIELTNMSGTSSLYKNIITNYGEFTQSGGTISSSVQYVNLIYNADNGTVGSEDCSDLLGELSNNGTTYYFEENEDGTYTPTNKGVNSSTAYSYIEIDLTGYEDFYQIVVKASISSESNYDFGYVTLNTSVDDVNYDNSDGRFMYISGTVSSKDYMSSTLKGGQIYYLHLGYRKDASNHTGNDQVVIESIKLIKQVGGNTIITDGNLTATNSYGRAITNVSTGNVEMTGGTITTNGTYGYGIYSTSAGDITISGGTITTTNSNGYGIYNTGSGNTTITGGTITTSGQNAYGLYNKGTGNVTISDGSITATYKGSTATSDYGSDAIRNESTGVVIIYGGTFSGVDYALYNTGTTSIYIYGGTFKTTLSGNSAIYNTSGTILFDGGTVSSLSCGIYNNGTETITIESGTITGLIGVQNNSTGTIIIKGGTITGSSTYGVYNYSTGIVTLGEKDGTVTTENPYIYGATYGLYNNNSSGVFNFYDGAIEGKESQSIYGTITDIEEEYSVKKYGSGELAEFDIDSGREIAILVINEVARVESTQIVYTTLYKAIEAVNESETDVDTITMLDNAIIIGSSETEPINSGKTITLDLAGYTITASNENTITNHGTLEILDSSTSGTGEVYSTANIPILNEEDGNLILTELTIETVGSSNTAVLNTSTGNVTVTGGSISTKGSTTYGIQNDGTGDVEITNGTITMGTSSTYGSSSFAVYNTGSGNVTISSGTFKTYGPTGYVVYNTGEGNITIDDGSFSANYCGRSSSGSDSGNYGAWCLVNSGSGTVTINYGTFWAYDMGIVNSGAGDIYMYDGTVSGSFYYTPAVKNTSTGSFNLYGGSITTSRYDAHGIYNTGSGTITVEGGDISTTSGSSSGINNSSSGTINFSGGTITTTSSSSSGIASSSSGKVIMTGGSITTSGSSARGINNSSSGTVTMTGGSITTSSSDAHGIVTATGNIEMTDGTITVTGSSTSAIVSTSSGSCLITGGIITASQRNAIENQSSGTLTIGIDDDEVSTTVPNITGNSSGVSNSDSGKFYFYDGAITGATGTSISGGINLVPNGYSVIVTEDEENETETSTLGFDSDVAEVNGIKYDSLQDAVDAVEAIDANEKQVTTSYSYTDYSDENLILQLEGENNTGNGNDSFTTTWKDLIGDNDAVSKGTLTNWSTNSLVLNGYTYYTVPAPNDTSYGTVEIAVKINSKLSLVSTSYWYNCPCIFGCDLSGTQKDWGVIIDRNGYFAIGYANSTIASSTIYALDDTVHTIAYSYTEGKLVFSIDGEIIKTISYTPSGTSCTYYGIGWNNSGTGTAIKGEIYSLRFYEGELDEETLKSNYEIDQARFVNSEQDTYDYDNTDATTVTILKNITRTDSTYISEGKKIKLDLNGKTVKIDGLSNKGSLEIVDSSEDQTGAFENVGNSTLDTLYNTGDIKVTSGTISKKYTTTNGSAIKSANSNASIEVTGGTITSSLIGIHNISGTNVTTIMSGGTITTSGSYGYGIYNYNVADILITGGTITTSGTYGYGIYNSSNAAVTMTEGTITTTNSHGYGIYSNSKEDLILDDVTISTAGSNAYGIYNTSSGSVIVNNVSITASKGQGIYNNSTGSIIITNSEVYGGQYYGIYNYSTGTVTVENSSISGVSALYTKTSVVVEISNSTLSGTTYSTVDLYGATTINITNSTITAGTGSGSYGIYSPAASNVILENVTITSTRNSINNTSSGNVTVIGNTSITSSAGSGIVNSGSGTITLGENDGGMPSTTTPSVTGSTYGVQISSGTFNFYDGIINGGTSAIYGTVTNKPDEYDVVYPNDEETTAILGIVASFENLILVGTTYYDSIETAINAIANTTSQAGVIEICNDFELTSGITIPEGANITIALEGHQMTYFGDGALITNNGTLTIVDYEDVEDGEEDTISILKNSGGIAIKNDGTLIIGQKDNLNSESPKIIGTTAIEGNSYTLNSGTIEDTGEVSNVINEEVGLKSMKIAATEEITGVSNSIVINEETVLATETDSIANTTEYTKEDVNVTVTSNAIPVLTVYVAEIEETISYSVNYYTDDYTTATDTETEIAIVKYSEEKILDVDTDIIKNKEYTGYKLNYIMIGETKYDSISKLPETVADGTVIEVYYAIDEDQTKDLSYTVEYYKNGTKQEDDTQEDIVTVQILEENILSIDTSLIPSDKYTGYRLSYIKVNDQTFTSIDDLPETVESGTTINVYYVIDDGNTKDLVYTVEYYKNGTKQENDTQKDVITVQILEEDTLSIDTSLIPSDKYTGYKLSYIKIEETTYNSIDGLPTIVADGTIIEVYYAMDEDQTKDLSYTVEYYINEIKQENDTQEDIVTVQILEEDTLSIDTSLIPSDKYTGYKLSYIKIEETTYNSIDDMPTIVADGTIIEVYYAIDEDQTKDLSYTVEYYKDGTKQEDDTQKDVVTVQILEDDALSIDTTLIPSDKYEGYKLSYIIINETTYNSLDKIPVMVADGIVIEVYYVQEEEILDQNEEENPDQDENKEDSNDKAEDDSDEENEEEESDRENETEDQTEESENIKVIYSGKSDESDTKSDTTEETTSIQTVKTGDNIIVSFIVLIIAIGVETICIIAWLHKKNKSN